MIEDHIMNGDYVVIEPTQVAEIPVSDGCGFSRKR